MTSRDSECFLTFALSLAGGGYRGLFTIEFLTLLEDDIGPISSKFSLFAGTSVGALNAIGLSLGYRAEELRDFFIDLGNDVFPGEFNPFKKYKDKFIGSGNCDPVNLRNAIEKITQGKTLGETIHPLAITAVDITTARSKVFKSSQIGGSAADQRIKLVDIALASAAAPTFFPPHKIDANIYVDGGLFANAPDLTASVNLCSLELVPERRRLLSISALDSNNALPSSEKTEKLSGAQLINPLNPILLNQIMASQIFHARDCAKQIIGGKNYATVAPNPSAEQDKVLGLDKADEVARDTLRAVARAAYDDFNDRYADSWMSELRL